MYTLWEGCYWTWPSLLLLQIYSKERAKSWHHIHLHKLHVWLLIRLVLEVRKESGQEGKEREEELQSEEKVKGDVLRTYWQSSMFSLAGSSMYSEAGLRSWQCGQCSCVVSVLDRILYEGKSCLHNHNCHTVLSVMCVWVHVCMCAYIIVYIIILIPLYLCNSNFKLVCLCSSKWHFRHFSLMNKGGVAYGTYVHCLTLPACGFRFLPLMHVIHLETQSVYMYKDVMPHC